MLTGGRARAGDLVATVPAAVPVHLQLVPDPGLVPPQFTTASLAPGWLAICDDPSTLLGLEPGVATYDPGAHRPSR